MKTNIKKQSAMGNKQLAIQSGKYSLFFVFFVLIRFSLVSQNVGINATGATPNASAMLDVASTISGMLIPRMTGAEKYAITSPATGLLIFQTDTVGFWYYDGTKWLPLLSSTSSTGGNTSGWGLSGNSGTDTTNNFIGTTDNMGLKIITNDTNRIYVDKGGNVGIGTVAPSVKLDIKSTYDKIRLSNIDTYSEINSFEGMGGESFLDIAPIPQTASDKALIRLFRRTNTTNSVGLYIQKGDNTTDFNAYISGNGNTYLAYATGNVSIGGVVPSVKLDVNGNVNCTGGSCASDVRWKKDITPLCNSLDKVLMLQGVNYYWKTKEFPAKNFREEKQIGFIAQEVEKVFPELIITLDDGYKSMDYEKMTVVLLEAIKEQQKMIYDLKTDNETIKAELQTLREQIMITNNNNNSN